MQIQNVSIDSIKPYENNPRDNDQGVDAVAKSIKEFNWQQPIVVDKDHVIIVGHTRYKAAKKLGMKEVPVVVADKLSPEQVKAYRLADNKTGELTDWDDDLLDSELNDILNIDMSDYGFDFENDAEVVKRQFDDEYSQKVKAINYAPSAEKPEINELADTQKYDDLVDEIDASGLPESVKKFLRIGATRFIKFNFDKIADYYAASSKQVQKAFEDQLLVIIDYDKAIEKGLINFQQQIEDAERKEGIVDGRFE